VIAKAVNGRSRLPLGGTASAWRRNQTSQVPSAKQQQEAGEGDQRGFASASGLLSYAV